MSHHWQCHSVSIEDHHIPLKMSLQVLILVILLISASTAKSRNYLFSTKSCKYEFTINEMDVKKCPGSMNSLESTVRTDDLKTMDIASRGRTKDLEDRLLNEMVQNRILNQTIANQELVMKKMEEIISQQTENVTKLHDKLSLLEKHIYDHVKEQGKEMQHKLLEVMVNVGELSSVVEKKLKGFKTSEKMETTKSIEVLAGNEVTHCLLSPNVTLAKDCGDLYQQGHTTSGVYYIKPLYTPCSIPVWCDMDTHPGGWLVLQRRQDGSENFNRKWDDYRKGFGDVSGEFWLGNDNLFLLTNQDHYMLRIDLWDFFDSRVYAEYKFFRIDGERDDYTVHVTNHTGTAPDGFGKHNGLKFSANDRDNDKWENYHCSQEWEAGWWFNNCWYVILNGAYQNASSVSPYKGIAWNDWKTDQLKAVEMKIRPSP